MQIMENNKRRVAILTSGGDSPGMNNAIAAVYRTINGINSEKAANKTPNIDKRPWELVLILNGYKGIIEKEIYEINDYWQKMLAIAPRQGGTIIGSARFKAFEDEEVRKKAKKILDENKIEALIAIGGDGTFTGLQKLSDLGIQCVGIPGTIDNDLACTDWTVGFDTALNTVVEAIDRIRETSDSHSRVAIVEIMGRNCGDLTIKSGVNCDIISTPEFKIEENELINIVAELHTKQKLRSIVIGTTENLYDVKKLAKKIEDQLKIETRATVLGQVQRGGKPSAFDRYLASMMGIFAMEQLEKTAKTSIVIGLQANKLVAMPIQDALNMPKNKKIGTISKILRLSGILNKKK